MTDDNEQQEVEQVDEQDEAESEPEVTDVPEETEPEPALPASDGSEEGPTPEQIMDLLVGIQTSAGETSNEIERQFEKIRQQFTRAVEDLRAIEDDVPDYMMGQYQRTISQAYQLATLGNGQRGQ